MGCRYIEKNKDKYEVGHLKGVNEFYGGLVERLGEAVKKTALSIQ